MDPESTTRVLVIDDDTVEANGIASFLESHHYDVETCPGLEGARDVLARWRPHVLVLAPAAEADRHMALEGLRKVHPRIPVVLLTESQGQDVLLDIEAFAPALPVPADHGFGRIESAIEAASHFA